jgi:hypothetical protein
LRGGNNPSLLIDIDPGQKLIEVHLEILGHRAGSVSLEQKGQTSARNRKGEQDGHDTPNNKPQSKGVAAHAVGSGTM